MPKTLSNFCYIDTSGQHLAKPQILMKGKFLIKFGTNTSTQGKMNIANCDLIIICREKYDKLIEVKRRVDPDYVFTANGLGVDATNAAFSKCVKITTK